MKLRTLFVAVVPIIAAVVTADAQQVPQQPAVSDVVWPTKLEAALASKGNLLVKDFYEVGQVGSAFGGLTVEALVITPFTHEDRRVKGLRMEVRDVSGQTDRSSTSFLDIEELDRLSRALAYMSDLAARWKELGKPDYSEVEFTTNGDFHVGFSQRQQDQRGFVSSGSSDAVNARIDVADLAKVKAMVDQGLALLQGK